MEKAKAHGLYAVLGLGQRASKKDIRRAYEKLALRFDSEESPWAVQPSRFQVESAYDILGDPKKRADYDQSRARARACARFYQEVKNTLERTCDPRERSPLTGQSRAALGRPQPKRAGTRRTPLRAQVRVQAQLRAHASYLARVQKEQVELRQEHLQALRVEIWEAGMGPDDEFEKVWELVEEMFELDTVNTVDEQKALVREALEQEAKAIEEKAAREKEAAVEAEAEAAAKAAVEAEAEAAAKTAVQARTKEIEWINKEAADSILVLAGMGARPTRPLATGYAQMLREDHVRRLIEKTNDLLDYLWDKAHSGDWICPEIKDAVDLDRLLELVLQGDAQVSNFPSATQSLAASLLRKWRDEECDTTDDGISIAQEAGSSLFSDSESSDFESSEGGSSSDDSDSEEEALSADLQFYTQAANPQDSPFAQTTQQSSPIAQNAQQKSPLAVSNQQHNTGAEASFAGYKRAQPPDPYEEQENQQSKRQKHINYA